MTNDPQGVTTPINTSGVYFNLDISSSVTWGLGTFPNDEILIYGSVNVKTGGKLTIENGMTVKFARNSQLIIEPNGLVDHRGILTSVCGDYWQGIEVRGEGGITNQFPLTNGQYQQGRFISGENNKIENARIGLLLINGGQATCNRTAFRNNHIAVQINKYANNIPAISQLGTLSNLGGNQNYKGDFRGCMFSNDNSYPANLETDGYHFYAFSNINQVKGIKFLGCTFKNLREEVCIGSPLYSCRGFGIHSVSAGFSASYYGTTNAKCIFEGLGVGILASLVSPSRPIQITRSTFKKNATGIELRNVTGASVWNNDFELGNLPAFTGNATQYGTVFSQNSEFEYSWNNFYTVDGNVQNTVGTCNYKLGSANNEVTHNFYTGLTIGNVANSNNASADLLSGLHYECNENSGNSAYDFIASNATDRIRRNQGHLVGEDPVTGEFIFHSASNIFSHQNICDFSDLFKSSQQLRYYYYDNGLGDLNKEKPKYDNLNDFEVIPVNKYECFGLNGTGDGSNNQSIDDIRSQYFVALNNYLQSKQQQQQVLSTGTASEIEAINQSMSGHHSEVYRLAKLGLFYAMYDSLTYSADSVWAWQSRLWTYESDIRLAFEFASLGYADRYNTVMGQMSQRFTLTTDQQTELNQVNEIFPIISDGDVDNFSNVEKQKLLDIANFENLSGAYSKHLLAKIGYTFSANNCSLPLCILAREQLEQTTNDHQIFNCSIIPNPTAGAAIVKFEQNTQESLFGKITDVLGRQVKSFEIPANSIDFHLDLSSNRPGIYYWMITNGKTERKSGKIIINK